LLIQETNSFLTGRRPRIELTRRNHFSVQLQPAERFQARIDLLEGLAKLWALTKCIDGTIEGDGIRLELLPYEDGVTHRKHVGFVVRSADMITNDPRNRLTHRRAHCCFLQLVGQTL
jgi:hypothetical protein